MKSYYYWVKARVSKRQLMILENWEKEVKLIFMETQSFLALRNEDFRQGGWYILVLLLQF